MRRKIPTFGDRLRILYFCYDHPENPWVGGGGAGRTFQINACMADRHDITVLCGPFPGQREMNAPFAVRFAGSAGGYVESRLKYMANASRTDLSPYDLVVEEFSFYAPVLSRLSSRPSITIVESCHGLGALSFHPLIGFLSLFSQYGVLPFRRAAVIVSEHLRPAVKKSALTAVIGQGAKIPDDLPERAPGCVLYVGRLDLDIKGLDTLVRAWARVPDVAARFPLHIIGSGDEEGLAKLIRETGAENVRLLGRMPQKQALAAMRTAAVVCVPSRSEGSPLVVYEALAAGAPVIGSDIPPIAELIEEDISGRTFPVGDFKALAAVFSETLSDPEHLSCLETGAAAAGKRFLWPETAKRQESFYFDVIRDFNARR